MQENLEQNNLQNPHNKNKSFVVFLGIFTLAHLIIDLIFYLRSDNFFASFFARNFGAMSLFYIGGVGIFISIVAYVLSIVGVFKIKKMIKTNNPLYQLIIISFIINIILFIVTVYHKYSIFNYHF